MRYTKILRGGWVLRIEEEEESTLTLFNRRLKDRAYFVAKAPKLEVSEYPQGSFRDIVIKGLKGNSVIFKVMITITPTSVEVRA